MEVVAAAPTNKGQGMDAVDVRACAGAANVKDELWAMGDS
jgi:hypothetical protein